uniref:Uncharacterized protein n=1 Tax=Aegilops tauschii subsp. strangulata TaxID=200361 RepID=A0A453L1L8_AEGTS
TAGDNWVAGEKKLTFRTWKQQGPRAPASSCLRAFFSPMKASETSQGRVVPFSSLEESMSLNQVWYPFYCYHCAVSAESSYYMVNNQ